MDARPALLILGTYHMGNPGRDVVNFVADDVLTPDRQAQILEVVQRLEAFQPTKIAVEVDPSRTEDLQRRYQAYRSGGRHLKRDEVEQIGFRLAKRLGHSRLYPVDWLRELPVAPETMDFMTFVERHGQSEWLDRAKRIAEQIHSELAEIQQKGTILDMLRYLNRPEVLRRSHQAYFWIARIGQADHYPGAEWVQYWYGRNLKIFVNLLRIAELPQDRILLVIGHGHAWLLRQFAQESGFFVVEDPLTYL